MDNRSTSEARGQQLPARFGYGLLAVRAGLALVFFVFGLEKLVSPHRWFAYLPAMLDTGLGPLDPPALLRLMGVGELLAALTLASGLFFRVGCGIGLAILTGAAVNVGAFEEAIRDVGLLVALIGLSVAGAGPCAVTVRLRRPAGRNAERRSFVSWTRVGLLGSAVTVVVALAAVVDGFMRTRPDHGGMTKNSPSSRSRIFSPIPNAPALDARRVALGKRLFHDTILSSDRSVSCATCHRAEHGGAEPTRYSTGIGGHVGSTNAPTVLNAAFNPLLMWDGRFATLEEQAGGPVTNPVEMGSSWPAVIAELTSDPDYVRAFDSAYGTGITRRNVQDALATYERTLVTPGAPFDRYLQGDDTALTPLEKRGFELFQRVGCASCHQGVNLGGNMIQRMGVMEDYFAARGNVTEADYGRYNVTKRESDRYRFRVPTLRNVALTPPYLHDGTATSLEAVIQIMAQYQAGAALATDEVAAIAAFLRSLSAPPPERTPR